MSTKPTLRLLDFQPVIYQGQQLWLLRDPMQLSEQQLFLPTPLAIMLSLMDGTRDLQQLHRDFCIEVGELVPFEVVQETIDALDSAYLLDNERSRQAMQRELAAFRSQPHRPPALAGLGYPGNPRELSQFLESYSDGHVNGHQEWRGRAIVSPHIDYQRGGPVYAQVWQQAAGAVAAADLVLIFGTDHNGGLGTVTLTQQPYATPYGTLPAEPELVNKLAAALGPEKAFELELNHREEHSIELSAVWLHHTYQRLGQEPAPMVPILCGSFHHFVHNGHHPADDEMLNAFVRTLQEETAGRNVLAVASVDLAHVGPNFGDPFPIDSQRQEMLTSSDRRLVAAINKGDHAAFYKEIASVGDGNRICGFSSLYLMLRYLDGAQGVEVAYQHCPADENDTSFVSICGLLLE